MSNVGGLAERNMRESLLYLITVVLQRRGWLDAGRRHRPIQVIAKPQNWDESVEPNLIAAQFFRSVEEEVEAGNVMLTKRTDMVELTLYLENESLAIDVGGDISSALAGDLPDIDRERAVLEIYDWNQPTPTVVGYAAIDNVDETRTATRVRRNWMSHWTTISLELVRWYGGD